LDIAKLPGIGPGRAKILAEVGISTVEDLTNYLPRDYDDRSEIKTISMLTPGITHTIRGTITSEPENISFRASKIMTKIRLEDETGELTLVWFGQPYLKKNFKKNDSYLFTGRVSENYGRLQMESPEYEKINQEVETLSSGRIVPIYTLPKGISQKMFRKWMKAALDLGVGEQETLPNSVIGDLCSRKEAIQNIHFPDSDSGFYAARRRLVFEELFFIQLSLLNIKEAPQVGISIGGDISEFLPKFPFTLTRAQQSVLCEITSDMKSGWRMNRLVQGDVGSGKTAVAACAAYLAINAGYQAAIMAPTEVLARQHYRQFKQYFDDTVLLIGSLSTKEKKQAQKAIHDGQAKMIVGTHALIQESVAFDNLALVITDEQHRFGVNQRAALIEKGQDVPHTMLMTATPIPRTLGLILYGDMDISVIDALPPGRKPIETYCVNSGYRPRLQAFMAKHVNEGHQVYVICPAIDESEDFKSVTSYAADLQKNLPDIPVACLHGRLKDKEEIVTAFSSGKTPIIVSTTVIEVGVDVPTATLVVIENAERFGLAQLHQLRGRVGRGNAQSYCVLVTDSKSEHSKERMQAMEQTSDGFILSELDLKQRGPGDFFGVQQSGLPVFKIANLYRDIEILKEAQKAAASVVGLIETDGIIVM